MPDLSPLTNQHPTPTPAILITGGTSGIGLATAKLLHTRGFRVAVTGRSAEGIDRARGQLPDDVLIIQADSGSLSDTERAVDRIADGFGELTALFLNAGVTRQAPLPEVDEQSFDELFEANTKGAYFMLQRALPLMRDNSAIVITVGTGVLRGLVNGSALAASRGALLAMLPSIAKELAPRQIRVNAISPGAIDTPMWRNRGSVDEVSAMMSAVAATIPFGRFGTAEEVAATVAFLVSDDSSYITGQNIVVGGGL